MDITLYNYNGEPERLDKSGMLTFVTSYTGAVARANVSLRNPVLVLEESITNINSANYCYISEFGRYYYIREKSADINGLFTLVLACDPLMSFKPGILNLSGIVSKQSNIYNMYLPGNIKSEVRPLVTTKKFSPSLIIPGGTPPEFTNQSDVYILLAIGGK